MKTNINLYKLLNVLKKSGAPEAIRTPDPQIRSLIGHTIFISIIQKLVKSYRPINGAILFSLIYCFAMNPVFAMGHLMRHLGGNYVQAI